VSQGDRRLDVSAEAFDALFESVSVWGRWGEEDEAGALAHLTPERIVSAAGLVREGITCSLSSPLDTRLAPHNPTPAEHRMTMLGDVDIGLGELRFVKDSIGVDYHNDTHSHVDALCHVAFRGSLYNGRGMDRITADGADANSIEALKDGLVGRGVLLDIPRLRDVPWLEPGEHVLREDLEAAEREQHVTVREGDVLLVRTGHARRLAEHGSWDTTKAKAGLHPTAIPFVAERGVSALGSDGNNDTAPSSTEGVEFPVHVLAINAMGLHLLDYLQFEDLRVACEASGRWEFLFVAAPLRMEGGTGSPVNPLAIL
jgi:kynurenine formamidase